jgi:hypothetical protein
MAAADLSSQPNRLIGPTTMYGITERTYGKGERMNTLARLVCLLVRVEILREIQRQSGFALGTLPWERAA